MERADTVGSERVEFKSSSSKGKRLWKKVKYQLVEYHSLPGYLKDNEYIKGHYRANWPLKQALFSIFSIHNETLNVWTHLIGFFLFLSLTIYTATKVPKVVDLPKDLVTCLPSLPQMSYFYKLREEVSEWHIFKLLSNCLAERFPIANHTDVGFLQSMSNDLASTIAPLALDGRPITRWPFFTYLGGAMFCLLASTASHLLSCHSECLSYILLRIDYAGIATLIATSCYPLVYYSFTCYPWLCNFYLGFVTILGVAIVLSSLVPAFQKPEFRRTRAALFSGMGMFSILPILHKMVLFWDIPEAIHTTGYEVLAGSFYGLGALIYASRFPERWIPGKFDIIGHSHQLFHVLVVAGAYTHYRACLVYLNWRQFQGCYTNAATDIPSDQYFPILRL